MTLNECCNSCDDLRGLGAALDPAFMQWQQQVAMRPSSQPTQSITPVDYTSTIISLQQQIGSLRAQLASLPSMGSAQQIQAINAQILPLQQELQRLQSQQSVISRPMIQRSGIESIRLRDEQSALALTSKPSRICGYVQDGGNWEIVNAALSYFGVQVPANAPKGTPVYCSEREYAAVQNEIATASLQREISQKATATSQQMEVDRLVGNFSYRQPSGPADYFAAMKGLTSAQTVDLFTRGLAAIQGTIPGVPGDIGAAKKYVLGAVQNALNGNADRATMDNIARDLSDYIDRNQAVPNYSDMSAIVKKYIQMPTPQEQQLQYGTTAVPVAAPPSYYSQAPVRSISATTTNSTAPVQESKMPAWLLPVLAAGGILIIGMS